MSRFYPDAPRAGVSVLCHRGSSVLLVKRGKPPFKDYWSLPGGLIELGETLIDAAGRELLEETGISALIGDPVEIFDSIQRDESGNIVTHFILTVFTGAFVSGDLEAGDDAAAAEWVHLDHVGSRLTTPGTTERIHRHMPR